MFPAEGQKHWALRFVEFNDVLNSFTRPLVLGEWEKYMIYGSYNSNACYRCCYPGAWDPSPEFTHMRPWYKKFCDDCALRKEEHYNDILYGFPIKMKEFRVRRLNRELTLKRIQKVQNGTRWATHIMLDLKYREQMILGSINDNLLLERCENILVVKQLICSYVTHKGSLQASSCLSCGRNNDNGSNYCFNKCGIRNKITDINFTLTTYFFQPFEMHIHPHGKIADYFNRNWLHLDIYKIPDIQGTRVYFEDDILNQLNLGWGDTGIETMDLNFSSGSNTPSLEDNLEDRYQSEWFDDDDY